MLGLGVPGPEIRAIRGARSYRGGFDERIEDPEVADLLAVLEVLGVEDGAAGLLGRGDDERIIERIFPPAGDINRLMKEFHRGINCAEGFEDDREEAFRVRGRERLRETPEGRVEELLGDLIADDPAGFREGRGDESAGPVALCGVLVVKGIDEDVRVEEEFTAH